MGIDLATWRARIGLNYYHMCRPLQIRWRSSGGQLYQPGVASWGVGEVMNDTPLVLKGCMTVVALSLILQHVVHSWSKLKGRGGGGKVRCHWHEAMSQVRGTVDGVAMLLLSAIVVGITLLLVIAGDVERNPGPEGTALTLKAAINALNPVCDKWYKIGVQLEVPIPNLKNIARDSMDPLCDTLDYWMRNGPSPSWRCLVDALNVPSVGEKQLAKTVEEKYCSSDDQSSFDESKVSVQAKSPQVSNKDQKTTPEGRSQTSTQDDVLTTESPNANAAICTANTTPPPSEGTEKPPFGCGCGKCTFFSFIERGCPTPIPSASSFPYLNLSGLSHEQQQELRGRLRFESQQIMIRFQELVSATIESLISQKVSLDILVSHVMTLGAFQPVVKEPQVPLFQYCFQKLEAADTIPKVFLVLKDYFSFFNYHIIEHIIKKLGTEEDKAELQRYKRDFNQYAKRRIFECLPEFGPVSDVGHADIFVKVDLPYENYTVEEVEVFRHKLSEILRISSQGVLRLCRVEKGCFQFTFQVPSFVQQEIFPLSREQEKAVLVEGVIQLTCVDYQFLKDDLSQVGVEKKHQRDTDDDSGMGPSIFTDTKSTTFSEDQLDKELKEIDYELRVQGLIETAFHKSAECVLEPPLGARTGMWEDFRVLTEKKTKMQKDQDSVTAFHMSAIKGNLPTLKYFITECNCNPACPGPFGLTPLHLASQGGHLDIVKYLVSEHQIDPLCEDEAGSTPLHRACAGGSLAVAVYLTSELQKYTPIIELMSNLRNMWNSTPLHNVASNGHLGILQFFISNHNCDPNPIAEYGRTPLHYAATSGHLHIVKYLTGKQDCNPACFDKDQRIPFLYAGVVDTVKLLPVKKHCDPMCRDSDQNTPFHLAAQSGHMDIVKFFALEMHCDPTSRNADNLAPLHLAAVQGHLDMLKFFISDQNCDPNFPGKYGGTCLHAAAYSGHLHIIKYLTDEQGCNPSCLDKDKYTPLHCAAENGHIDIVKFLTVEKHCDSMCRDSTQCTPLHWAALNGHIEVVKFLTLEMHYDTTSKNAYNSTALHLAAQNGHLDIIQFFISGLNCDPNIPGQHGGTSLHCAAQFGHLHIVKYLTDEQGCNPSCLDENHLTPLHLAMKGGNLDMVQFFICHHNCDPNIPSQDGRTPLHFAAEFGHLHIVKYLTEEQGCNLSCLDEHNQTPLHCAAMVGQLNIVEFLTIEKHCDPMCRNSYQNTPLHMAAIGGHIEVVKFLALKMHCDPMFINSNLNTSLNSAVIGGHIEVVKFLILEMHCDPTSRNADNATALHLAVKKGHLDIIRFLMSSQNCDPNISGQHGRTPLHYAAECGHLHIVKYLTDEQGCNSSCLDHMNRTPTYRAAMRGHVNIVKFLILEKHSDPMLRDVYCNTMLHVAVLGGYLEIVKFLIEELRYPPDIPGQFNVTPLPLAVHVHKSHSDIAQYLQKHVLVSTAIAIMKQLGFLH